jgi:hypothetical protein
MAKLYIYVGISLGGIIGSYLPALFHTDILSAASIIGGIVGSFIGLYFGYRAYKNSDFNLITCQH